jgi:branched-subunit amino acid ABC-type transport system permease component
MFLPVALIVFLSWLVFWLPPDVIPARVGISTASIFSLIAFSLSIRLSLPRVSYVTHADLFLIGCTLLVILALGIVVAGSRWAKTDRMTDALRLNAVARWFYPGLFFLIAIITLMI